MITDRFKNIYIMTTMNCNIHCDHCFVPKINNELSDSDLERICAFINIHEEEDFMNLVFHGGEPTMVGTTRFREILEYLKANIKPTIRYRFNIQTNLVILNQELISIFKEYFEIVGVSYDVNIRHVKGGDFENIFFRNLERMRKEGIAVSGIITLTQEVLKMKPIKFYSFMKENFRDIHIEKLTHDGEAIKNWGKLGVNNREYSEYMQELFKIYSKDNPESEYFNISPFDAMCKGILSDTPYSCKGMCGNFYSFGPNSFVGTCTALTNGFNEGTKTENIQAENLKFVAEISKETQHACDGCEFLNICKSGCPSGKNTILDESGECRGAKTLLSFIREKLSSSARLEKHFKSKRLSMEMF